MNISIVLMIIKTCEQSKERILQEIKKQCPDDEEIERSKQIIERFNIKNGEGLTEIYLKSDVLFLACVF